jgi:hypothetical protein
LSSLLQPPTRFVVVALPKLLQARHFDDWSSLLQSFRCHRFAQVVGSALLTTSFAVVPFAAADSFPLLATNAATASTVENHEEYNMETLAIGLPRGR